MQKQEPFLVIFERGGTDQGFASYRVRGSEGPVSTRELDVRSLHAASAEAHESLWRFIFGIDLVETVLARNQPIDDALPWMLRDMRRLRRNVYDGIWLRLVDVPAVLAARTYSTPGRLVLEVDDAFCPWNEGTYALEVCRGWQRLLLTRRRCAGAGAGGGRPRSDLSRRHLACDAGGGGADRGARGGRGVAGGGDVSHGLRALVRARLLAPSISEAAGDPARPRSDRGSGAPHRPGQRTRGDRGHGGVRGSLGSPPGGCGSRSGDRR